MAGYVPLEIDAYASFSRIIVLSNEDGTQQNLVGSYANSFIRETQFSSTIYVLDAQITSANTGEITLSMTAANTGLMPPGRYLYDVVETDDLGERSRLIEGIVVVNPGITQF